MSPDFDPTKVAAIIATQRHRPGALLPILHDIQHALGYIPPDAVAQIAEALNLSRAEVHGVITFYHHFRNTPPAKHAIHICCAEACQSMGAERLTQHAEKVWRRYRKMNVNCIRSTAWDCAQVLRR
jgi:formate dehydrogenase subunit gamma